MPECHKCQYFSDLQAGKYKNMPWKDVPCSSCHWTGDQINHHGRSHVSIDAGSSYQTLGEVESALRKMIDDADNADEKATLGKIVADVSIARGFLTLSDAQRRIVLLALTYPGYSQRELAELAGCTPQNVSSLLKQARDRWPELAVVFRFQYSKVVNHSERDASGRFRPGHKLGFKPGNKYGRGWRKIQKKHG